MFGEVFHEIWFPTFIVGLVTLLIVRYFYVLSRYPTGPLPLPLLGNLLAMYFEKEPLYKSAKRLAKKYGDPFTLWIGSSPFIITTSPKYLEEFTGPKRNDFSGRPQFRLSEIQLRGADSVIFSDFNKAWDALRKVLHLAVRKYAVSDKLQELCADVVDRLLDEKCQSKTSVSLDHLIQPLTLNIVGTSAFGDAFNFGNDKTKEFIRMNQEFTELFGSGLPSDLSPILAYVYYRKEQRLRDMMVKGTQITDDLYNSAKKDYQQGQIRHFVDALLAARDEAEQEERSIATYLTERNLNQVIQDLFGAGEGTTRVALKWITILLANDQELQNTLRHSVLSAIGERPPKLSDMLSDRDLARINSFIQEVLRLYPPAPIGMHKTMWPTTLGGKTIPKDTAVIINFYEANTDPQLYDDPFKFDPERFLNKDKKQSHYTFGLGPRSCVGEKMAQADIFYVTVRLLQRCKISLPPGTPQADMEPIFSAFQMEPKDQPVMIELL